MRGPQCRHRAMRPGGMARTDDFGVEAGGVPDGGEVAGGDHLVPLHDPCGAGGVSWHPAKGSRHEAAGGSGKAVRPADTFEFLWGPWKIDVTLPSPPPGTSSAPLVCVCPSTPLTPPSPTHGRRGWGVRPVGRTVLVEADGDVGDVGHDVVEPIVQRLRGRQRPLPHPHRHLGGGRVGRRHKIRVGVAVGSLSPTGTGTGGGPSPVPTANRPILEWQRGRQRAGEDGRGPN